MPAVEEASAAGVRSGVSSGRTAARAARRSRLNLMCDDVLFEHYDESSGAHAGIDDILKAAGAA